MLPQIFSRPFIKIIFNTTVLFFLAFLATGLRIYDDYGLSFDEAVQRTENGIVNCDYILTGNDSALLESREKYHGPAFEIFLVFIERTLNLTDERSIYLSRHLATFLLFFIGVFFFYRLSCNYFNSKGAALLSCAILVLSPRIFADSFYNSKDIAFLAVFIISIYFLTQFIKKQNFLFAFAHALITGILVDIRITGIIVPLVTVLIFLIDGVLKIKQGKLTGWYGYLFLYLFLSAIFVILFWPVLWTDPWVHFLAALREMSKFPWFGDVTYMGRTYLANMLPWHYLPVWIFISTPLVYIALFILGVFFTAVRLMNTPLEFYKNEKESLIFLTWFFVPLLSVILLGAVVYDGWRHLYFIYPPVVLFSVSGFYSLIHFLDEKSFATGKKILNAVVWFSLIYITFIMIISHPYQNVYFNFLAGNPEGKFERDYWGVSFRKGLEHILETDSSEKIVFTGSNSDVALNRQMLPQKDNARLVHTSYFEFADYYLDNFRWKRWVNQPVEEIFSLEPLHVKIMSVYKVRHRESEKTIRMINNDFERRYMGWSSCRDTFIGATAYSGNTVCRIDTSDVYSSEISIPYDSLTRGGKAFVVFASLQAFALDTANAPVLVISTGNQEQENVYWSALKLWTPGKAKPGKWKRAVLEVEIPGSFPPSYQFKAYIWNPFKGSMYLDDFAITIVEANK